MLEINRNNPTPIYLQVKVWLQQQVENGIWPEHYKLLNEHDLSDSLGVSRGTIRKAVTELINEGLLVRIHGKGTFVASQLLEQSLAQRLIGISEDLIEKGISYTTQVIDQSLVIPNGRISSLLSMESGKEVFFLKRVRLVAQQPFVLIHNYVNPELCTGIEKFDFSKYRLFGVLENEFGLMIDWGRRTFEAQAANKDIAELLMVEDHEPVMNLKQTVYLQNGYPIETSDVWFKGNEYRLTATVKREHSR